MSNFVGILKPPGEGGLQLHTDTNWLPEPYPEAHSTTTTFCWATKTLNRDAGCTKAVPGSHKLRRQPTPERSGPGNLNNTLRCSQSA